MLGKCDVCKVNDAIGVACTAIPLSVAYCVECARQDAQPECVFLLWEEEIGSPKNHARPDHYKIYADGKYVSYRKWYNERHKQDQGVVPITTSEVTEPTRPKVPKGDGT